LVVVVTDFKGTHPAPIGFDAQGDKGFLDSMIPHHSRALLVCEESRLVDPEIISLCQQIIESQTKEINQMKQILERY